MNHRPPSYSYRLFYIFALLVSIPSLIEAANWAQLAGKRAQKITKPYIPQAFYAYKYTQRTSSSTSTSSNAKSMWSPRWGHAVVVLNQTSTYRNDLSVQENSQRVVGLVPKLFVLGGDDYTVDEDKDPSGRLHNDIWYSELGLVSTSSSVSTWTKGKKSNPGGQHTTLTTDLDPNYVTSSMTWKQSRADEVAPPFWPNREKEKNSGFSMIPLTFDDWITCQDYFIEKDQQRQLPDGFQCDDENSSVNKFKEKNIWSPRRGHAAAVANDALYVIGGRSREQIRVKDDQGLIGGLFGSEVNTRVGVRVESNREHLTVRESSVLKNDVWVSTDGFGKSWKLVTVGCRDHQEDIIGRTEVWSKDNETFAGSLGATCTQPSDCYGEAICKTVRGSFNKVCVCPMFSAREHHSLSVQYRYKKQSHSDSDDDGVNTTISTSERETLLYVVGGFTNVRQKFCASRACSFRGSYRMALDDAWVSINGTKWVQIRPANAYRGGYKPRGAHATILMHANLFRRPEAMDKLWIMGGENVHPTTNSSEYLNDIWTVDLSTEPCCVRTSSCDTDIHTYDLDEDDIGQCLPELSDWKWSEAEVPWAGRAGHTAIYEPPSSLNAFKDFIYVVGGRNDTTVHSDVWSLDASTIQSWKLDFSSGETITKETSMNAYGDGTKSLKPYQFHFDMNSALATLVRAHLPVTKWMENEQFTPPAAHPFFSEEDIIYLNKYALVSLSDLRSADKITMLQVRDIVKDICFARALVIAFEAKCSIQGIPGAKDVGSACKDADNFEKCVAKEWDGCSTIEGYSYINVYGIGTVPVPTETIDPSHDLENMYCKQTPGPRYMSAGQYVDGNAVLLGGQGISAKVLHQDVWARDNSAPMATIKTKPKSGSSQSTFLFECDEDGAFQFEYKIFDFTERLDVTPWLVALKDEGADVAWLDSKKGGPGSGYYTLYVRAVDPSGNRDTSYSSETNAYTWLYVEPIPWGKVIGSIFGIVVLIAIAILEYRRRERKKALIRYAQRRMRRKFKLNSMQEAGDEDWKGAVFQQNDVNKKDKDTIRKKKVGPMSNEDDEQKRARRRQRRKRREHLREQQYDSEEDDTRVNMKVRRRPNKSKTG